MSSRHLVSRPAVLQGTYIPPGDKSISHRALMFGALAEGISRFTNFLEAEDCLHTMMAFQKLGIPVDLKKGAGEIAVQGRGMRGFLLPSDLHEIYLGNSGTSMRLLLGILAGQRFEVTLTGDPSLSIRPMKRVTQPLKQMGAQIKGRDNGNFAPLKIHGGRLQGIDYENNLGSAQVKSAILLAGLYAEGVTRVHEILPSRDHTERLLTACGAPFEKDGDWLRVRKAQSLKPVSFEIPGDISSAAFFMVGAAMTPGSDVVIEKVGLNPKRLGLIHALNRMGASVEIKQTQAEPEPIGSIRIVGRRLTGIRVTKSEIPSLIDELPILMIAMSLAEGESLIAGAEELRVKETDRIHSMVTNLKSIGGHIEELPDGCLIKGVEKLMSGKIQSFGDHRTAMSFAIASLAIQGDLTIEDTDCIATSFPTFFRDFEALKKEQK